MTISIEINQHNIASIPVEEWGIGIRVDCF
jgi:hypothetical protein